MQKNCDRSSMNSERAKKVLIHLIIKRNFFESCLSNRKLNQFMLSWKSTSKLYHNCDRFTDGFDSTPVLLVMHKHKE